MFSLLNKAKNFIKSDIRWKLKKIGKIINLTIYPKKIYRTGIKFLYSLFIFNLVFSEKSKVLKKYFKNKIFFKKGTYMEKYNLLVSTQRSGGTFTRMMLTSYIELLYKTGNGIPKYDSINDKWIFNISPIVNGDLYNSINFENLILNSNPFNSEEEYEKKKIIFTRYPITPLENYSLEETKPVVIMRNPYDQIISFYTNHYQKINDDKLDLSLFKRSHQNYLKYFEFWKNYFDKKTSKKDYLIIKHEDLVSSSEKKLREILVFYNYEIKDDLISKAAAINSKENTLKYIENVKIRKIRFTDPARKEIYKEKVIEELKKIYQNDELIKDYDNLS